MLSPQHEEITLEVGLCNVLTKTKSGVQVVLGKIGVILVNNLHEDYLT